jgi:hypothetical protein
VIPERRQGAIERALDTFDAALVPWLADYRLFRVANAHRGGGHATEGEPGAPHPTGALSIDGHGRGDRADVVETSLCDLVETGAE